METRRQQMLNAAELLIRQTGGTDFSMRALATAAEVSPATPFNVFGSKEGLLFALLNRNLAHFMSEGLRRATEDPVERVIQAAESAVAILLRDSVFTRPLYQVMLGLTDPLHHPAFLKDAFVFYWSSLDLAAEHQLITDDDDRNSLACSLMAYFIGVLDLWVLEDIDDDRFHAQIAYGFIHLLWPIARGTSLKRLQERYLEVKKDLSNRQHVPSLVGRGSSKKRSPPKLA